MSKGTRPIGVKGLDLFADREAFLPGNISTIVFISSPDLHSSREFKGIIYKNTILNNLSSLFGDLPSSLFVYIPSSLFVYIPSNLFVYIHSSLFVHIPSSLFAYIPSSSFVYIPYSLFVYIPSSLFVNIPSSLFVFIPSSLFVYIPFSLFVYIPSSLFVYFPSSLFVYLLPIIIYSPQCCTMDLRNILAIINSLQYTTIDRSSTLHERLRAVHLNKRGKKIKWKTFS